MKFDPAELRDLAKVPYEQARKACSYNVEQLAAANPKDLMLLIGGLEVWSARIVAHAKIITGGKPEQPNIHVVVAGQVSFNTINLLLQVAVDTWRRKGVQTAGPLFVKLERGTGLWVQLIGYHFRISDLDFGTSILAPRYDVHGPAGLMGALSRLGDDRLRGIPVDGLLRALASFAESYSYND